MLTRILFLLVAGAVVLFGAVSRPGTAQVAKPVTVSATDAWQITGALSETCTCSVPCSCNFGQGPSPHHYCYAFYAYHIKQGHYGAVTLDGLHFGATDLKSGRTFFIEQTATAPQREAIKLILARVIEKATVAEASQTARDLTPDVRYVAMRQEYDNRSNHLEIPGVGEFRADYLMGMDKTQPIVVHNNTTWRLADVIKAKTTLFKIRVGADALNVRDTNSNQGDFDYNDKTDFGAPATWSCGAETGGQRHHAATDPMCGAKR